MADTNLNLDWVSRIQQGGPLQSSVVIKANPTWASTVSGRMQPYKNMPEKFRPALEAIAEYVRTQMIPSTFSKEGPGWRRLSRRSQADRLAQGFSPQHPILRRTGDLFKELTEKSHPKHVEFINVGPNARVVIGGRSEKFVRNQLGSSIFHIPARPMIPGTGWLAVPARDNQAIQQIFTQKVKEAISHGGS